MKPKIRDLTLFLLGAFFVLLTHPYWSDNKTDFELLNGKSNQDNAQNFRKDENLPSIIRGTFQSPHLSVKDLLTDNFLNSLIRGEKKKEVLDGMYGKPISVIQSNDSIVVSYNMSVYDDNLRRSGGRVGFIATFKNGAIKSWSPIIQD